MSKILSSNTIKNKTKTVQKFKIWKMNSYFKTTEFINNNFEEYDIITIVKLLETDRGYNMRVEKGKNYIFFGDCDHFRGTYENFELLLITFMKEHYGLDIESDDISYTVNYSKTGSFHYSIPKYYASCKKIKEIHEKFKNTYEDIFVYCDENNKEVIVVDTGIYCDHWFRLPNQHKFKNISTRHLIQRGTMEDFIVEYIPESSTCIENITLINTKKETEKKPKKVNKADNKSKQELSEEIIEIDEHSEDFDELENVNDILSKEDCKKLLDGLDINKRCNDRANWIIIGQILKNHSDGKNLDLFNMWKKWSQISDKYKEGCCETQWKSFKKMKTGVKLGTLLKMIKDDNPEYFKEIQKLLKIRNIITKNKENFPNNDLQIDQIVTGNNSHYIDLLDKYCPIKQDNHDDRYNYMELSKYGDLVLKCRCGSCRGQEYPKHGIQICNNDLKCLFNLTQINNYYGSENNKDIEIEYIDVFDDKIFNDLIIKSLNGTHYDIAEVLFYKIKDRFVFADKDSDSDTKVWYEFYDYKWRISIRLRNLISKMLPDYYQQVIDYYKNNKSQNNADKIKKINELIKSLKISNTKNNIMTELEELSQIETNESFFNKLDSKSYLLGFNNGVYDFNQMIFRKSEPEDYVSMTCGYDYVENHTNNLEKLKKFLSDSQSDEKQLDYLLTSISSCLSGKNFEELFTILTGVGRNGKSKLISLIKKTFGDYFAPVSSKLFTRPRPDANSPDPGLLHLAKVRIVVATEPEKTDKINSGFIKFLTGNDSASFRKCHGNKMMNFQANFITFLVCNDIPDIDDMDKAFAKRLRCISFDTIFCENPKEQNERQINKNLDEELDFFVQDFMLILIQKYTEYIDGGKKLIPTSKIMEFTNLYKEEVDIYLSFLNECTKESDLNVFISDLYESFKFWYKNKNPNTKLPNSREFNNGIRKHKDIHKSIRCNNKVSVGIKNLEIVELD